MKKKWLCLILAVLLMPCISVFSACNEGTGYDLSKLVTDYNKIVEGLDYVSIEDGQIEFNYTNESLAKALELEPYAKVNNFYNPLLDNSMNFAYGYIDAMSKGSANSSNSIRNKIKKDLDELQISLLKLDGGITDLIPIVDFVLNNPDDNDMTSPMCMSSLSNLFYYYEQVIQSALKLNEDLATCYFTYNITNSNPNYYDMKLVDMDASEVILNVRSRQRFQVVNVTRLFVEMNVDGAELYNKFTGRNVDEPMMTEPPAEYENYQKSIALAREPVESSRAETINNVDEYKKKLKELAVELYNVQSVLDNDIDKYTIAIDEIKYVYSALDPNATVRELACVELIEDYNQLIGEYNSVLAKLIEFIKSV